MFKDYRVDPTRLENLQWNLKRVRRFMGLNQKELSDMLGYEQSYICFLEVGRVKMRAVTYLAIVKLCERFYSKQDSLWHNLIRDEFVHDFTEKRPKESGWLTDYSLQARKFALTKGLGS